MLSFAGQVLRTGNFCSKGAIPVRHVSACPRLASAPISHHRKIWSVKSVIEACWHEEECYEHADPTGHCCSVIVVFQGLACGCRTASASEASIFRVGWVGSDYFFIVFLMYFAFLLRCRDAPLAGSMLPHGSSSPEGTVAISQNLSSPWVGLSPTGQHLLRHYPENNATAG